MSGYYDIFTEIIPRDRLDRDVPMSRLTSFRIGGNADVVCSPRNADDIIACIRQARKHSIPYMIMGNGSNLLVGDKGIRGLVIRINDGMDEMHIDNDVIYAQGGAKLSALARFCTDNGYCGMEFASGIPGTVGGGLFMNAGAYDSELKDFVISAEVVTAELDKVTLRRDEMDLGYRHSVFQEKNSVITCVAFRLNKGDKEESLRLIDELTARRRASQPLKYPSAGSAFKRPVGGYAARLIDEAGLKGFGVGGAKVSEQHAGFIINSGDATAEDVLKLMDLIIEKVKENSGITLEPEVKFVGE